MDLARIAPASLGLFFGVALAHACGDSPATECQPGSDACTCADGDLCLNGLQCIGGWCQALPADTTGAEATAQAPTGGSDDTTDSTTSTSPTSTSPTSPTSTTSTTATETTTTDPDTTTSAGDPTIPGLVWHKLLEPGEAHDVEFTPAGQVAVAGYLQRTQYDKDAWLGLFSGDGEMQWEQTHSGDWGLDDQFHGVAVHGSGNINVAGQVHMDASGRDIVSITYDPQGVQQFIHTYNGNGPLSPDDVGFGAAFDADGNTFVCGYSTEDLDQTGYTARHGDISGESWTAFLGTDVEQRHDCKVGPGGYLVTVGQAAWRTRIERFEPDADETYDLTHSVMDVTETLPNALAIDPADESVYVAGYTTLGLPTESAPWLARWNVAGDLQWAVEPAPDGETMRAEDIVIDEQGWVRVVGSTKLGDVWSIFILTYDSEGVERDRTLWSLPGGEVRAFGAAVRGDVLFIVGATAILEPEILLASFAI